MTSQERPESSRHDDVVENSAFERIGLSARLSLSERRKTYALKGTTLRHLSLI